MEPIEISISKNQRLSEALALSQYKYTQIPPNVILNKTLTGIGATYMEIKAFRHSIIIEPNVPVIKGKEKNNQECLGVYKGRTVEHIIKYLQNPSPEYKKLLTTPEGFFKITEAALKAGIDIHADYFCLFDECEKIGQDLDYRKSITFPINDFFNFTNKAFVSATPLKQAHDEFDLQKFKMLVIKPDFDYRVKLELIVTDKIRTTIGQKIQTLLDDNSKCICIFFNSTKGIKGLITQFSLTNDNCSVFCSDKSKSDLKVKDIVAYTDFHPLHLKRFNFFTSRYYSAVDFHLSHCPDVIMITDLYTADHSTIDPLSEAIQIQGRFRNEHPNGKRFNSLCHIANFKCVEHLTYEESVQELNVWFDFAKHLKEKHKQATNSNDKKSIEKQFKKCLIYPYLQTLNLESAFKRNTFSIINKYNKERVKAYYSDETLKHAYEQETGYFDITYIDEIDRTFNFDFSSKDIAKRYGNPKTAQNVIIQDIIYQLDRGITSETILSTLKDVRYSERYDQVHTVIEAYKLLGSTKLKTTFKGIDKDLKAAELFKASEDKRFSTDIINEIITEFEPDLNKQILKSDINERLQKIYDKYSLIKKSGIPLVVTQLMIFDYFHGKNNKDDRTYTLKSALPDIHKKSKDNS